jgi:hypothetical protein
MKKPFLKFRLSELTQSNNWHKLVKMPREEVVALEKEWKETEAANSIIYNENRVAIAQIKLEIDELFTKYSILTKRAWPSKVNKKWYNDLLTEFSSNTNYNSYPYIEPNFNRKVEVDGCQVSISSSPMGILQGYDLLKSQISTDKELKQRQTKYFTHCILEAVANKIDIEGLNESEIIDKVETVLKDRWLADNYPPGTEIDIDDNYCECASYTIGERRCGCGSRRIETSVDGNCLNGYFISTSPY